MIGGVGSGNPVGAPATGPNSDEARLKKTATQLEGLFVQQLYKAMRDTVPQGEGAVDGGSGEEMFTGMMDQQLATDTPKHWEHGLAAAAYKQLRRALPGAEKESPVATQPNNLVKPQTAVPLTKQEPVALRSTLLPLSEDVTMMAQYPMMSLSLAQVGAGTPVGTPRTPVRATAIEHPPAALDALRGALLDAMRSERKLLEDLTSTMRRQRTAVGTEDLQTVDDSVFATHRILATLGQARVRRRQINRLLAGVDDLPGRELDAVLGTAMTDDLRGAREELQATAGVLAREVDVNRRVLRDALANGDAHARILVGAPASGNEGEMPAGAAMAGRYGSPPPAMPKPAGGVLLNRTA